MDLFTQPTTKHHRDWQCVSGDAAMLSHRSSCATVLLQNCDLPPPIKLFSLIQPPESLSLLKALQLSQTRAREAEMAAALDSVRNQQMVRLLWEDLQSLSAHQRWLKLLEAEVSLLRQRRDIYSKKEVGGGGKDGNGDCDDGGVPAAKMWLALASCLGIAGVGFVLGQYRLRCVE